jgi:hypothetical protein
MVTGRGIPVHHGPANAGTRPAPDSPAHQVNRSRPPGVAGAAAAVHDGGLAGPVNGKRARVAAPTGRPHVRGGRRSRAASTPGQVVEADLPCSSRCLSSHALASPWAFSTLVRYASAFDQLRRMFARLRAWGEVCGGRRFPRGGACPSSYPTDRCSWMREMARPQDPASAPCEPVHRVSEHPAPPVARRRPGGLAATFSHHLPHPACRARPAVPQSAPDTSGRKAVGPVGAVGRSRMADIRIVTTADTPRDSPGSRAARARADCKQTGGGLAYLERGRRPGP